MSSHSLVELLLQEDATGAPVKKQGRKTQSQLDPAGRDKLSDTGGGRGAHSNKIGSFIRKLNPAVDAADTRVVDSEASGLEDLPF